MASSSNRSVNLSDLDIIPLRYTYGTIPQAPDRVTLSSRPDLSLYDWFQPWRSKALCAEMGLDNPDAFFPPRGGSGAETPGEDIRAMCFQCPVRLDCLAYSVEVMPKFGWFGGHPEDGRKKIRRLMRRGVELESADAIVLTKSLIKMRRGRQLAS